MGKGCKDKVTWADQYFKKMYTRESRRLSALCKRLTRRLITYSFHHDKTKDPAYIDLMAKEIIDFAKPIKSLKKDKDAYRATIERRNKNRAKK